MVIFNKACQCEGEVREQQTATCRLHLVSAVWLVWKGNISRAVGHRPALLLRCQAVALILRTFGILARLAVAVQAVLVHPVAREVL